MQTHNEDQECVCVCVCVWCVCLTGMSTAEEPGMLGSGRLPAMEAGRGCLCLFLRWRREDKEPGTGLGTERGMERERGRKEGERVRGVGDG